MASVTGKNGSVTFSGITAGVRNWTLNYVGETVDTTKYSDQPTRTFLGTVTNWSGTFGGFFDTANTAVPLSTGSATFTVTTGETYIGTIIITGMAIGSAVDGVTTCEWTYQGSGTLQITSA